MKKYTITRRELMELMADYRKDMDDIEELYHNGEINRATKEELKLYVWCKKRYIPLWHAFKGNVAVC